MSVANTVLHIPHSATAIPASVRHSLTLDDWALEAELLAMTDHLTDQLFQLPGATRVVYPVSRLVVDPERFPDDSREPMAGRGMGVVYTTTSTGQELRRSPNPAERRELLESFYNPHHEALAAAVAGCLERAGACLLVDCHSFPARARSFELDQEAPRPDINLGTDEFHTPPGLTAGARAAFEAVGFWVEVDRPYSGTLVPTLFYRRDARVSALMVEVNRRLYLDETTGRPLSAFGEIRSRIGAALALLA